MAAKKTSNPTPRDAQAALLRAKGYLPALELAAKLKNDPATIYRWLDNGEIEGIVVMNRRYVSIDSVIRKLTPKIAVIFGIITEQQAASFEAAQKNARH